jgi:hypothetical protein
VIAIGGLATASVALTGTAIGLWGITTDSSGGATISQGRVGVALTRGGTPDPGTLPTSDVAADEGDVLSVQFGQAEIVAGAQGATQANGIVTLADDLQIPVTVTTLADQNMGLTYTLARPSGYGVPVKLVRIDETSWTCGTVPSAAVDTASADLTDVVAVAADGVAPGTVVEHHWCLIVPNQDRVYENSATVRVDTPGIGSGTKTDDTTWKAIVRPDYGSPGAYTISLSHELARP